MIFVNPAVTPGVPSGTRIYVTPGPGLSDRLGKSSVPVRYGFMKHQRVRTQPIDYFSLRPSSPEAPQRKLCRFAVGSHSRAPHSSIAESASSLANRGYVLSRRGAKCIRDRSKKPSVTVSFQLFITPSRKPPAAGEHECAA